MSATASTPWGRRRAAGWAKAWTGKLSVSLPQVWAFVCLGGIFIILSLWLIRPHDFWWHMRVGQWIVEQRAIPAVDVFSFTQTGQPWAYQSWVMEVVFYLLYRAGGLPLVIFFHALVVTGGYALVMRVCQRAAAGDLRIAALVTVAAATAGVASWNVRPQTISLLLFALTLYLADREARDPGLRGQRALWWLPPIFAVWANAHGGFVFGLGLLGVFLLARLIAWRQHKGPFPTRLFVVTACSAAACLLTPLGWGMVKYVLYFTRHPMNQTQNMEFLPPTVQTLDGQLFFAFLAVLLGSLCLSRRRTSLRESLLLVSFGVLALLSRRCVVWFAIAASPTIAASVVHLIDQRHQASTRSSLSAVSRVPSAWTLRSGPGHVVNGVLAVSLAALVTLSLPWLRPYLPLPKWRQAFVSPETPVEAVAVLDTLSGPRRVFHEVGYGSYMIWASRDVPVFIDTRVELYPAEQWVDYIALSQARYDWQSLLDRYDVDTLLLDRELQAPLVEAVAADSEWEQGYSDDRAVVFQRAGMTW